MSIYILGALIRSVCISHISISFELTGDTCAVLLVGMANAFGTVGHVQQSAGRMAKRILKEFQKVSEVQTPYRM